jgi:septum formation protein
VTRPQDLIVASASPRRRELLERLGLSLRIAPVDLDETPSDGEAARDYVQRMASDKCEEAVRRCGPTPLAILAADTIVVLRGAILGKPADEAQAVGMLRALAGHRHEVLTAYAIAHGDRRVTRVVETFVDFRSLDAGELAAYLASGEWRGKAGAYAIQGIASAFVSQIRGSFTNVVGLPVAEVVADLRALGALPQYPPPAFGEAA